MIFKWLQRRNWWPKCEKFHRSQFWSDFIFKASSGILNVGVKLSFEIWNCRAKCKKFVLQSWPNCYSSAPIMSPSLSFCHYGSITIEGKVGQIFIFILNYSKLIIWRTNNNGEYEGMQCADNMMINKTPSEEKCKEREW